MRTKGKRKPVKSFLALVSLVSLFLSGPFSGASSGEEPVYSGYNSYDQIYQQGTYVSPMTAPGYSPYSQVIPQTPAYGFYDSPRTKTGWWWYESPVKTPPVTETRRQPVEEKKEEKVKEEEKKEEKKEKKEVIVETRPEKESPVKPLTEYTYEELLYMSPEEFKKVFDYYLNLAIGKPTEENLYYFFNVLDVARKKAALFSSMYAYTMQKYAQYLPTVAYPYVNPGIHARIESQQKEVESYVYGKARDYGLIVFVKPGCPYCEVQLNILKPLLMRGIDYKVVDVTRHPEVVSRFGIEVTPTIILVHRTKGDFMPVASGVQSLDAIEENIMRALQLIEGTINPGQYGIYEFQKGTPVDPFEPPPLWKNKKQK